MPATPEVVGPAISLGPGFWVADPLAPLDGRIPFFNYHEDYYQNIRPYVPSQEQPDRVHPWLVEPGMHSIETYEAMLCRTVLLARPTMPLRRYICKAGIVQSVRLADDGVVLHPQVDCRRWQRRDVCFTLLSHVEHTAAADYFRRLGLTVAECQFVATPMGLMNMAVPRDMAARNGVCVRFRIGLDSHPTPQWFLRSYLPPGVKRIGAHGVRAWALPAEFGDRSAGLATSDDGCERILWEHERW